MTHAHAHALSVWCPCWGAEALRGVRIPRNRRVRCPVCRRRLTLKTRDLEPRGASYEAGYEMPAHKIPKTKRRKLATTLRAKEQP